MLYYSSKFAKDTNAFWYFCRDIVYVLFHERFSSISTWGNFVTFSLSMTIVSIFKKGSDSLKNLFFFFFFFFFFWGWVKCGIFFLLNSAIIYLLWTSEIFCYVHRSYQKKCHLSLCLKEVNWYRQQTLLDLVFLSIFNIIYVNYEEWWPKMDPWVHHIRLLSRQIFWCYCRHHRRCIEFGLKDNFWTTINMHHKALVYLNVFHDLLCQMLS